MARKSIFESLGLVESEPDVEIDISTQVPAESDQIAPAQTASAEADVDLINELYETLQMPIGKGTTVYLLKEYINTLPQEMTAAKMQETLNRMFKVANIDVADIILDAENRTSALETERARIESDEDACIASANDDIENLKMMIERANQKIADCTKKIQKVNATVTSEIAMIESLKKFADQMMQQKGE